MKEFYNLKSLKTKDILPFYISDINDKFFMSLNNHPNKNFVNKILPKIQKNLDEDELLEFLEINNLTKAEKIKWMLNLALRRIISKTGSFDHDLFEVLGVNNYKEPFYISEVVEYEKESNSKDSQINRRYNFYINVNPGSYLYRYLKQIQLSFYLDEDNEILSGGFSLNYKTANEEMNFENSVKEIYLRTLVKNFIVKQLYPMSLDNILDLVDKYNPIKKSLRSKQIKKSKKNSLEFSEVNIYDIKSNWVELINKKYFTDQNLSDDEKKYYEDVLFFSIMTTTTIMLSLYEELRIYFTHQKPELILQLLNKPQNIKEDPNQNPELDFFELSKFLKSSYFQPNNINLKKIKTTKEIIESLSQIAAENKSESFGFPIPVYEIVDSRNNSIVTESSLFKNNDQLKMLYLLIIYPELFGMDEDSSYFIDYRQLVNVIRNNKWESLFSFKEKLELTKCEINFNFTSFIGSSFVMMIIMTEQIDVYHDYLWAQIYAQSLNWIRRDIEFEFDNDPNPKKNSIFYGEKIQTLENITFDWYGEFYGLTQIRNIVYKIDKISNLKGSIQILIQKIRDKDQTYKKDTERTILVYAFIAAALIGFNNFFGLVYTILGAQNNEKLSTSGIAVISVSTIVAVLLIGILAYYLAKVYFQRKRLKNSTKDSY